MKKLDTFEGIFRHCYILLILIDVFFFFVKSDVCLLELYQCGK